jgi:cobalt-zinc-cadmium efflux system protein
VKNIHSIHIWSLEGEADILTAHIVVEDEFLLGPYKIRQAIKSQLENQHIEHSTLELETNGFCSGRECIFESDSDNN